MPWSLKIRKNAMAFESPRIPRAEAPAEMPWYMKPTEPFVAQCSRRTC